MITYSLKFWYLLEIYHLLLPISNVPYSIFIGLWLIFYFFLFIFLVIHWNFVISRLRARCANNNSRQVFLIETSSHFCCALKMVWWFIDFCQIFLWLRNIYDFGFLLCRWSSWHFEIIVDLWIVDGYANVDRFFEWSLWRLMLMCLVFGKYFANGLVFAWRGVMEEFGEVLIFLFVEVVLFGGLHWIILLFVIFYNEQQQIIHITIHFVWSPSL